jgi:hypothetical protein
MYFASSVETIATLSVILACGYALWRGGRAERLAASLLLIDWLATPLLQVYGAPGRVQHPILVMDATVAAALFVIAMVSNRFWPMWMTAFQALELLMHLAMLLDHKVHARAYFVGMEISSYLILLALLAGTWLEAPRGRLMFAKAAERKR